MRASTNVPWRLHNAFQHYYVSTAHQLFASGRKAVQGGAFLCTNKTKRRLISRHEVVDVDEGGGLQGMRRKMCTAWEKVRSAD